MKKTEFKKLLKEKSIDFIIENGKIIINGGSVDLSSLTSMPEGVTFSNGGDVYLSSHRENILTPYLERFKIKETDGHVILYKKVSCDFKTQENTKNETLWDIGKTLEHPAWNPKNSECGEGKFHACAKPFWGDSFRNLKGDRYIAVQISVNDLFEWKDKPNYPQKIGFRKGTVLYEVDRLGNLI
jgi:hypothetical protein